MSAVRQSGGRGLRRVLLPVLILWGASGAAQSIDPSDGRYALIEDGSMPPWVVPVLRLVSSTHVEPTTGLVLSDTGLVLVPMGFAAEGDEVIAACRLTGSRQLAAADAPQTTLHFRGRVRLGSPPRADSTGPPPAADGPAVGAGDVYRIYFHGPAYQVVGSAWRSEDASVARWAEGVPANHRPDDLPLPAHLAVCDLVYRPIETKLLRQARAAGATALDGLGMLFFDPAIRRIFGGDDPGASHLLIDDYDIERLIDRLEELDAEFGLDA